MEWALKVGDWVYYNGNNESLSGSIGYVKMVGISSCLVNFIQGPFTTYPLELRVQTCRLVKSEIDGPDTKEDYRDLIELALSLGDFAWCKELADREKENG